VLPAGGLSLSVAGYKVKGIQHADLAWSGATTSTVTIARDGAVIATVPNSPVSGGAYTDNIGSKGAGTHTYQVCEGAAGGSCSNVVIVTF
jgi:serine protease